MRMLSVIVWMENKILVVSIVLEQTVESRSSTIKVLRGEKKGSRHVIWFQPESLQRDQQNRL